MAMFDASLTIIRRVSSSGFKVSSSRFRVPGFELGVHGPHPSPLHGRGEVCALKVVIEFMLYYVSLSEVED
jgi:hypothetical protein